MKVRIKFRKYGALKFIGHLDVMRYFQKALRRAEIPVKLTGGYSPHMIMSFANPLGVGVTSDGEYFDLELTSKISSKDAVERLQQVMVEGIDIVNVVEIPDDKKQKGMAIVAAADYVSGLKYDEWPQDWKEKAVEFSEKKQIVLCKKTKKSEKEVDIRPMIYAFEARKNEIFMRLATGSVENLKPSLVMQGFLEFMNVNTERTLLYYHRLDVYANIGTENEKQFVPLDALGTEIL